MILGSMFSGCDGMALGVQRVIGGTLAWHAEVDKDATKVLAHRFPGVPNLGDVTAVDWSTVEPVDVLIGGPPCQAVSSAGKGLGSADPRWMWPEALRAMRELRPSLCLWENPSRLLTGADKDEEDDDAPGGDLDGWGVDGAAVDPRWFGWLLGEMAALGFDAWWCCLRSADVGAPHRRDRVFIACAPADTRAERWERGASRGEPDLAWRNGNAAEWGESLSVATRGGSAAPCADSGPAVGDLLPTPSASPFEHADMENLLARRARVKESTGNGNGFGLLGMAVALLPTPRTSDTNGSGEHGDGGLDLRTAVALLPTPVAEPSTGNGHARNLGAEARRWGRYAAAVERWERLSRPAPEPVDAKGRLNPALPEWMMGFDAGWVTDVPGVSRTAQLRILGNSCQPQVAEAAALMLLAAVGAAA